MEKAEGRNKTLIMEFILVGFGDVGELQPLLFLVFLMIYIVTLAGNILIIALVVTDPHLQTPMYILLGNLAFLETCYTSTVLPRYLTSLLTGDRTISVKGCIVQLYFFAVTSSIENLLLTTMSYDRYLAICHPLRYTTLMNSRVCCQLVAGSWVFSIVNCSIVSSLLFYFTFCNSKEIDHFFCDFTPMLKLSCDDTQTLQLLAFIGAAIGTLVPCLLTLVSYVCIITTVLQIPSSSGRRKAFSTCSSHLIVVTFYYGIVITLYVAPTVSTSQILHKILSVFCTVLTPMVNPFIYCLRNSEVSECLRKAIHKVIAVRIRHSTGKDEF